ncbi:hypothetical protein HYU96_01210 [Candidatus Daviesbacteria bacterium]|nr:hypothetical protein [Candidatus Daviesbacteria bacterium]
MNIYILKATKRLYGFIENIDKIAKQTVIKVENILRLPEIDIVIYDNPEGAIPELGVGGFSPSAHLIFIFLNPKFQDFNRTINQELERTLTHELHHCLRWQAIGYGKTLLEAMVSEGLADHFDIEVTGQKPQPWDNALTIAQIKKFQKIAEKEYQKRNYNHEDWFFGSKKKNIPRWTAYTLGFYLIKEYFKRNSNKKASNLYSLKAEEFLK